MKQRNNNDYREKDSFPSPALQGPSRMQRISSMKSSDTLNQISWTVVKETGPSLLASSFGLLLAGKIMNYIEESNFMHSEPSILILLPILLGLKCQLEMSFSSRLSSAFHATALKHHRQIHGFLLDPVVLGNVAVVHLQAVVLAILSAIMSALTQTERPFFSSLFSTLNVSILSLLPATSLLSLVTIGIISAAGYFQFDPDFVCAPLVTSFGDPFLLYMMMIIVWSSQTILNHSQLSIVAAVWTFAIVWWSWSTISRSNNKQLQHTLVTGWTPMLIGMLLGTISGHVLEDNLGNNFNGYYAFLLPCLNGSGGSLAGIYANKRATWTRSKGKRKMDPRQPVARTLVLLTVPLFVLFIVAASMQLNQPVTLVFSLRYLSGAVTQTGLLIGIAEWLSIRASNLNLDPGDQVSPYLTALGDLLGTTITFIMTRY